MTSLACSALRVDAGRHQAKGSCGGSRWRPHRSRSAFRGDAPDRRSACQGVADSVGGPVAFGSPRRERLQGTATGSLSPTLTLSATGLRRD